MSAEILNQILDILLKTYIVCVMFAMGLTLAVSQIEEQLKRTSLMMKALR